MVDLEFSPDGNFLAVAETGNRYEAFNGIQGKARIWDVQTWEDVFLLSSAGLSATSLAFNPNGDYLAVGNASGEIQIWRWRLQRVDTTLTGHDTWVNALAFGSGGGLMISGSGAVFNVNTGGDSTIRLWLVTPVDESREFFILIPEEAHLGAGWSVGISPDGGIFAAGMTNGTVHLWGSESKREFAVLDGYAWANDLLFTPDSSQIVYAGYDGVRIWNISAAVETFGNVPEYLLIAPLDEGEFISSLTLSPDGDVLAVGYADSSVRLWDFSTGEQLKILEGHEEQVVSLAFSPDGTSLASGGADGTVRLWGVPAEE
jgi:WD40 repeat protein